MLRLRKVERPAVGLGSRRYNIDDKRYYCRNMTPEKEPGAFLLCDKLGYIHSAGKHADCHQRDSERKLITDHLCAASHCSDECILVIGCPAGKQNAKHTY